jgi:hypothetical protein
LKVVILRIMFVGSIITIAMTAVYVLITLT